VKATAVCHHAPAWSADGEPYVTCMTDIPDDNLDHYALGFHAPRKGLRRQDCPYADGTEPHAQWIAGYDAAVKERQDGPEP
jgi:ribosome modulation factor